jgi:hypothetical protein
MISPSTSCFSFETALSTSPVSTDELFQSGWLEGRGHDVLRQAVQPVRQLATPGWPLRGEPLVAPPTQQQGLGTQGLVERELVEFWAVLDQADPAADPEAFVTGRFLDDSVEPLSLTTIFPILILLSVSCWARGLVSQGQIRGRLEIHVQQRALRVNEIFDRSRSRCFDVFAVG